MTVTCDQLDVKKLTGIELYTRKEDESSGGGMLRNDGKNVFVGEIGR
jgi:hypothetical protein